MASANLPGDLIAWAINMTHPDMEWSADQCEPAIHAARLILAAVGLEPVEKPEAWASTYPRGSAAPAILPDTANDERLIRKYDRN